MNEVLGELRATLGWGVLGGCRGVQLRQKAEWGAGGTEVLCLRRWEEVWVEGDDRAKSFRCDA